MSRKDILQEMKEKEDAIQAAINDAKAFADAHHLSFEANLGELAGTYYGDGHEDRDPNDDAQIDGWYSSFFSY